MRRSSFEGKLSVIKWNKHKWLNKLFEFSVCLKSCSYYTTFAIEDVLLTTTVIRNKLPALHAKKLSLTVQFLAQV